MSGIFGFITNKQTMNNQTINIKPMLMWNRLYGNSNESYFEKPGMSMGCCIEMLWGKHVQKDPVLSNHKQYAVIDAVIYNRIELIEKSNANREISDAELLLLYVNLFGPDALKDINGDFSGAIYNDEKKELILFRDHMGIRPLFYYAENGIVAYSTDLRGLVALPSVDVTIREEWIFQTVNGYSADTIDNTPYENIYCVTPATYISFSFDKTSLKSKIKKYWKLRQHKIKLSNEQAYQEELRELITDSVKRRLKVAPDPIGAELSGGLDSGVIAILINRSGRKGIYYSWSLDPDELKLTDDDERLVIKDICRQENITCNYTSMKMEYTNRVYELMQKTGVKITSDESNDFRFAYPPWSNTDTIIIGAQNVAAKGSRVMFTGHGGDEGVSHRCSAYEMFHYKEYYRYFHYIWTATQGHKHRIFKTLSTGIKHIKGKKSERKKPYISWSASPELLKQEFLSNISITRVYKLHFDHDPVTYIETGGSRNRLDNLALFGALARVRYMVPYLDYRVIDYAVSIPRYLYLKGKTNRYIYREAFKDIIPDSLYKLQLKEDTSIKNLKSDPDWYESFARRKLEIINKLDRGFWGKYLDFEKIDKLAKAGKPTDEEYEVETRQLKCLLACALAQNLVEKARQY